MTLPTTRLRNFLSANEWRKADTETARLLFDLQGESDYGDGKIYSEVRFSGWDNVSCEDLHEINQLWVDYSKDHFGFSIQKEIYQRIGVTREYDRNTWQRFGSTVGWRVENDKWWNCWGQCTFDLTAPQGHLPLMGVWLEGNAYDDNGRLDKWGGWNLGIEDWYSQVTDWHVTDVEDRSHSKFSSFMSRLIGCNIHAEQSACTPTV
ncbi:GUN4 domain-containing protein [Nostoc sp.]|uniref:GUN4 domain-containing protein n=1 Tax=Nostoc sp. TaxID=1180 RepID=UPI003593B127